jgi:hypothetical protein
MNDSLRLISHSLPRCSATTKNDNAANNLVKTSAGTAVNDFGETFSIGQACIDKNDKFTSWSLFANSDAYFLGKKLGLNKDSSGFSVELGQVKPLPTREIYNGAKLSILDPSNKPADGLQNNFHRVIKDLGGTPDTNPPTFNEKGPNGVGLSFRQETRQELSRNSNGLVVGSTRGLEAGGAVINGDLYPTAEISAGVQARQSINGKQPPSSSIVDKPTEAVEIQLGVEGSCQVNKIDSVFGADGKPVNGCQASLKAGVHIPTGPGSSVLFEVNKTIGVTEKLGEHLNTEGTGFQIKFNQQL